MPSPKLCLALFALPLLAQQRSDAITALSRAASASIEQRDGRWPDPAVETLLNEIAAKLAPVDPPPVHATRSGLVYAIQLPGRIIYVSAGLIARAANEAELAGFLAHALAHPPVQKAGPGQGIIVLNRCALALPYAFGMRSEWRDAERAATAAALPKLAAAGYDPTALLDALSKLSYDQPQLATAINGDDILAIRNEWEQQQPARNLTLDSSRFAALRQTVRAQLFRLERNTPSLRRRATSHQP